MSRTHPGIVAVAVAIAAFLVAFLVIPVVTVVYTAFSDGQGGFTLAHFSAFSGISLMRESFANSLYVAGMTVGLGTLIAVPLAYLTVRFQFRGAILIQTLGVLPLVMPAFVGAAAMQLLFGRNGRDLPGSGHPCKNAADLLAQLACGRVPILRCFGHRASNQRIQLDRQGRIERGYFRRRLCQHGQGELHQVVAFERQLAREHFEEQYARAVDVAALIDLLRQNLLGCHVGRGSCHFPGLQGRGGARRGSLNPINFQVTHYGEPEVEHFYLALRG